MGIEGNWTEEELEETLYQRDPDPSVRIINELKYENLPPPTAIQPEDETADANAEDNVEKDADGNTDVNANANSNENNTQEEIAQDNKPEPEPQGPPPALDLDLSGDQVHIVEFYAPWCPHCQNYRIHYIELANELLRRSINQQITFHAISCTLNPHICSWYEISGYPSILGWRGGTEYGNIIENGVFLNEYGNFSAATIAEDLGFDLAQETVKYEKEESKFSHSEDQREYEEGKIQRGKDAAREKRELYEIVSDLNERYHNAAVSLAYILKNGIYVSARKQLTVQQKSALYDFLALVDWASPQTWDVRSIMIRDLLHRFDDIMSEGKTGLSAFVETYQQHSFKRGRRREELLWGHLDESFHVKVLKKRSILKGSLGAEHGIHVKDAAAIAKEHSAWTSHCTHGNPYSGFTCGLWELFHLLSIGATHTPNQLYGFRKGYVISSKEVGATIHNFIANFFRCEVCKKNFVQMYEGCGHDHCKRLDNELPFVVEGTPSLHFSVAEADERDISRKEIVLWLWEVHNAVNSRLMDETAERERRVISEAELVAAKFPTKAQCPKCWLDGSLEVWDRQEVFNHLQGWYWPSGLPGSISWQKSQSDREGAPLSKIGLYFILVPICLTALSFVKHFFRNSRTAASRKMQ